MIQKIVKIFGKVFWIPFLAFIIVQFIISVLWSYFVDHIPLTQVDYTHEFTRGIVFGIVISFFMSFQSKMKPIRREDLNLPK